MLDAIPHRLVQRVTRVDALEHDGQLKVADRHVAADPGNIPPGPARARCRSRAGRSALCPVSAAAPSRPAAMRSGIPGGGLVTAMIYRIVAPTERKILTPAL